MLNLKQTSKTIKNIMGKNRRKNPNSMQYWTKSNISSDYTEGISVITPSYNGEKYISKLLKSMKDQKLSYDLFEHIIVINGDLDGTPQIIEDFKQKNPRMNIKVIYSEIASASNARNLAIEEAARNYSTFIDDDDYISPNYLKELYKNASENRIVIGSFFDAEENTGKISHSYITPELLDTSGLVTDPYSKIKATLSINACKLIPSFILKQVKFDVNLTSGEDIVFFCRLLTLFDLEFYVVDKKKQAIYYRILRSNSVSRKIMTFEFNVIDRLKVIKELNEILLDVNDDSKRTFIKQRIRAQTTFINRYVLEHPDEIKQVREIIRKTKLDYFPYDILNNDLAKKLIISYTFPPYTDTSGNVMAKRINEKAEIVDVIYNKMERDMDEKLNLIADKFIDKKNLISSPFNFGGWYEVKQFCNYGMERINELVAKKGEYEEIYSRAMFPASHFLAFEYKINYPDVKWTAEFSDPVIYDIKGNVRNSNIDDPEFIAKINNSLQKQGIPKCEDTDLFFLCEYLPYIFADVLVFTNENQKEYMISKFPNQEIVDIVKKKSRIERQPTPIKEFYNLEESDYLLDDNYVNLAYFGNFYDTRNLNEIFPALYILDKEYRDNCRIHFFTSNVEAFKEMIECNPLIENIKINSYVNFFEFLNLTTKFDCLIVNDAHTKEYKGMNPYLPSKLSDYLGSGTDIWAIYEEGSVLSKCDIKYKSVLDDIISAKEVLKQIITDHM